MRKLLLLLLFIPFGVLAQIENFDESETPAQLEFKNKIYKDFIRSVDLFQFPDAQSQPLIYLNTGNKIMLTFDDLSMEMHEINYTIVHCDSKWERSDIEFFRYADGIEEGYLTDYNYSRTMYQQYINYNLKIPNDEMQIRASGNYLLIVYRNNNLNDLLLTQRFYVAENRVNVSMDVHRAFDPKYRESKQEVDVEIAYPKMNLVNPNENVKLAILQNWRWDNAKTDLKPNFMGANTLTYNFEEENTFWAGNEQRFIDISNFNVRSEYVDGHVKREDTIHIFTTKEKPRFQHTIMDRRTNLFGARQFGLFGGSSVSVDPDYALVYFYLLADNEDVSGSYYVFGELSMFDYEDKFKMKYNAEKKRYECRLFLKQGMYNWQYLFMNERRDGGDPRPAEGSFSETLNSYSVLVYYKSVTDDYERIIGVRSTEFPTLGTE